MTISQRSTVADVEIDVTCTGRFYDFLEERNGVWGIVRRQPIYEKDRMDVLDRPPASSWTGHWWTASPSATAVSAICRPRPGSRSRAASRI
ncbi:hypothetical protein ACU61A_39955 [Pseudonocardia sichuanensis]